MSDPHKKNQSEAIPDDGDAPDIRTRREFLRSLGKWSAVIIGAALGGMIESPNAAGWVNGGGGSWVNARGGGGWINGKGGGGGWVNARGGGSGGSWVNRR